MESRITVTGAALAVLVGLILTVGVLEAVTRIAMPGWREFRSNRFMEDQALQLPGLPPVALGRRNYDGWFAQNNGDFRVHIRINDFHLRNDEEVAAAAGRLWVIGDSMAFGWGVDRAETYTDVIQKHLNVPTYNVASPGADICGYTAFWRRMPSDIRPQAVVVGLVLENDMRRYDCAREGESRSISGEAKAVPQWLLHFGKFKLLLTEKLALYNFLAVSTKRVPWLIEALQAVGLLAHEHIAYERFPPDQLDVVVSSTADALSSLRREVPESTPFVVLIAPTRFEIRDDTAFYKALREKTVAALQARGLEAVDPIAGFKAAGFDATHFVHDGHWSSLGHQVAGEAVASWLRARHPDLASVR